ncbi:MAG: isopentenyl-diphosphate Delta-isomerase [Bacteroidales bacterium]|nr:isopentenyl-diphosphate Delta-isomerase [Bacteroidales bacterium]
MELKEYVVLVNESDTVTGQMEKMEAHLKGQLHRAISVLIFNSKGEFLLQQRSFAKYHTPGLWSNTCCSHPRPSESVPEAAARRLMEEMGLDCELKKGFEFVYKADFPNGLIEFEYDHVYFGYTNNDPVINPEEAHAFKWMPAETLLEDMRSNPSTYTVWFRIILEKMEERMPELLHGKFV